MTTDRPNLLALLREAENRGAQFFPQDLSGDTRPYVEVAGISAFVYVHPDGALRVSLHFDDAADHPELWPDHEHAVPVKVDVGGAIIYEIDDQGSSRYPLADPAAPAGPVPVADQATLRGIAEAAELARADEPEEWGRGYADAVRDMAAWLAGDADQSADLERVING